MQKIPVLTWLFFAAPPSYEECVAGAVAIEEADENHPIEKQTFAPRYPVYNNFVGSP
jgi:hypothetical protein